MNNLITVLDVLDNFLDTQKEKNILKISGTELYNLGEEVRKFSNTYQLPTVNEYQNPIYLGGWPSANFWHALNSELLMTCLLYSGQILVKDPISDWFSDEQYYLTKFIS